MLFDKQVLLPAVSASLLCIPGNSYSSWFVVRNVPEQTCCWKDWNVLHPVPLHSPWPSDLSWIKCSIKRVMEVIYKIILFIYPVNNKNFKIWRGGNCLYLSWVQSTVPRYWLGSWVQTIWRIKYTFLLFPYTTARDYYTHRGITVISRGSRSSSFGLHEITPIMDSQAPTRNTVLIKSREMTGRSKTLPWWLGEG